MEFSIKYVDESKVDDLCLLCIPAQNASDPVFARGVEEKRKWSTEMLRKFRSFAKLAYVGSSPVGLIQYEPIVDERVVKIHCIYVPERTHWRKGIGKKLLCSVMEDAKNPLAWFGNEPALALVTRTFPGEKPGQCPARLFFTRMGFRQVGEDPDFLYYPMKEGFAYRPVVRKEAEYVPQREDEGKALIIYGPSPCPFSYVFLKRAEQAIVDVAPNITIRWIDKSEEPEEVMKRGNVEGCIVNAKLIRSFVLDKDSFKKEVREAMNR
ncbi:MAG: GNAT family N-acetyltransferase [Candidatus Brockarchaeota archaeon]|nr:GNAT family N-acetyltransferase [Candidatus Brockarchaeota archaeon]